VMRRGVFTSKVVGISSSKKKIRIGVNQNCEGKKQAKKKLFGFRGFRTGACEKI
jgi:hypothetical protein